MLKFCLICGIFERDKKRAKTIQFFLTFTKPLGAFYFPRLARLKTSQRKRKGFSVLRTTEEKRKNNKQGLLNLTPLLYTLESRLSIGF
jgi:hypothetical protein